jgi:peptidoglycan DL-endopeptidase CwlO
VGHAALGTRLKARMVGRHRISGWRRGIAFGAGLVFAGALAAGAAQIAGAAPQPSISQVQAQVNADQAKYDEAQQQYDGDTVQLTAAKNRLGQINGEVAAATKTYNKARKGVVQIAQASFEDSGQTSLAGLLTTSDPGTVLGMASILTELTGARNQQVQTFLADAQQLSSVQQTQQHTELGIQQLTDQAKALKDSAQQTLDHENAVLASLTTAQRAAIQTVGGSSGTTSPTSATTTTTPVIPPASSAAGKAVAYVIAMKNAHCHYVWAEAGPCSIGFDCSGLMQAAWIYAGYTQMPRDTAEEWAVLPHIPQSALAPGDLILYNNDTHVGMYVGGGMIVDAPHTGLDVEEIPFSTPWYADNITGFVRVP